MLRQAVALDPANPSLYSHLGDLYSRAGRPDDAMKLYQDAVKKGIRTAWLYSRLGQMYLRRGNPKEAIAHFESAATMNPHDYDSLENLAVAYKQTGRIDDAEAMLKMILQSGEEYAPAYNELGMISFQKGDRAAAQAYFEKAARLEPSYHLNLARLHKMAGENAKARASFEAFLAAKGSSPEYPGRSAAGEAGVRGGEIRNPGPPAYRRSRVGLTYQAGKIYQVRRMDNCRTRAPFWLP